MIYKKKRGIIFERFNTQTLAFDLSTNLPYVLNSIAAFILINSDGRKTLETIAEKICREFDVTYTQALDDVKKAHEEFKKKGLVVATE